MKLAIVITFLLLSFFLGTPGKAQSPDLVSYMSDVDSRAKRAWFPSRGEPVCTVVVHLKINKDGTASSIQIEKSSGSAMSDQLALAAVMNAAPFRKLPDDLPNPLEASISFNNKDFIAQSGSGINKIGTVPIVNYWALVENWLSIIIKVFAVGLMIWAAKARKSKLVAWSSCLFVVGSIAPGIINWLIASARDAGLL